MIAIYRTLQDLIHQESGQDLIEYALIAGLLGCTAIATVKSLATGINQAFAGIVTSFAAAI